MYLHTHKLAVVVAATVVLRACVRACVAVLREQGVNGQVEMAAVFGTATWCYDLPNR